MSTVKKYRRWFNKGEGVWKEKWYEYDTVKKKDPKTGGLKKTTHSRSRRSLLIVGKGGVYKDRLKDLLSATDDPAVQAEIKAKVNECKEMLQYGPCSSVS